MSRSYADMVSKALRHDAPLPPRFPADRERLVAAVGRGLRARRRHQHLVRWTMTASAAAAVLVLVVGGRTLLSPYAPAPMAGAGAISSSAGLKILRSPEQAGGAGVMLGAGTRVPLSEGMTLPEGFRLVAPPAGEVRIGAARGTTLALEGGGELDVSEAGIMQRYELRVGAVRARVAKLVSGERFVIATTDAEVEVHGTAFRVAVVPADPVCGGGTITRVAVTEGVVTVRHDGTEVRVMPGQVWPARCEGSTTTVGAGGNGSSPRVRGAGAQRAVTRPARTVPGVAAAAAAPLDMPSTEPAAPSEAPEATRATIPSVSLTRSELADQNDLFASAVRAKRRGQGSHAIRIFERFGRLYPGSPLAESAAAQRMKLLMVIDTVAARRAATEYLAHYPSGFARIEARHLLDGAP
jgi:FecR protein